MQLRMIAKSYNINLNSFLLKHTVMQVFMSIKTSLIAHDQ